MCNSASTSQKEEDFRLWELLQLILVGRKPREDLLGHREFQSRGGRICARIMQKYNGIMRMYYGASYDEEDLFNEACWRMMRFLHTLRADNIPDENAFFGWFFVLAHNIVRSKLRKFKKLREEGVTLIHVPIDDLQIADHHVELEWDCFRNRFLEFTETLPAKRRRAIQLWHEGHSTREIKTILNGEGIKCSNVSVQNWIKDTLNAFEKSLARGEDSGSDLKARRA